VSVLAVEVLYRKLLFVRPSFFSSVLFCFIPLCFFSDLDSELGSSSFDWYVIIIIILLSLNFTLGFGSPRFMGFATVIFVCEYLCLLFTLELIYLIIMHIL
jgi:hypothetical protein